MTIDIHPTAETPPDGPAKPGPAEAASLLADFVSVLIPGDGDWPSAADVGVQAVLATRLFEDLGRGQFARLAAALLAAGGPLRGRGEDEQVAIVRRFEAAEPALFGWVRDAAYIAYYENPFVAAAINAQGHPYDLRPHIKGYPVMPFDLERQTPRHGRGRYIATPDVRRVDTSTLDLDSERTQAWGLKR
ncbi:hypothetical protein [Labrys monachus]|uniref:Gluconate 2-dehydrogenase subunit 3 family protein n=1 Tax=Labrys monachus TaxID=217067 RepID=A0ABU0FF09_9HYPH|nr:hypothetical protein [Labrys monachus]MDQ0392912.1 hypothetical protein [Labrys monachus]